MTRQQNGVPAQSTSTDPIVTLARRSATLAQLIGKAEKAEREAQSSITKDLMKKVWSQRCNELNAIEEFISQAPCNTVEGALVQIMHIGSWAGQCQSDDDHCEDFERIQRMAESALFHLADALKVDLDQLGGGYFFGASLRRAAVVAGGAS